MQTSDEMIIHISVISLLSDLIQRTFFSPADTSKSTLTELPEFNKASNHEEIFDILDNAVCRKITKRLRYLYLTVEEDDPEAPEMDLLSLQRFAIFFAGLDDSFPIPEIVVINQDGFLKAEWYSAKAAALLNFQPNGDIIFAATMNGDADDNSQDIYGTARKELALRAIWPFINNHIIYA